MPHLLKLVILSGNSEGLVEDTTTVLRDYLTARLDVDQTVIQWPDEGGQVNLRPVEDADVVLVFTDRVEAPGAELERLTAYYDAGGSIVAVRCNGSAFAGWQGFESEVLGFEISASEGDRGQEQVPCRVDFGEPRREHAIVEGMEPFDACGERASASLVARSAGECENDGVSLEVVAEGVLPEGRVPAAWALERALTRERTGGRRQAPARVFATTLGHPRDFWEYDFLRLIENAVRWAGRQT